MPYVKRKKMIQVRVKSYRKKVTEKIAFLFLSLYFLHYSKMYPSLTSVSSRSRWYLHKPTTREVVDEITELEEKLAEKRQADIQVGTTIQIRGRAALPIKVTNIVDQDEEDDEEMMVARQPQDTNEEDMIEEEFQDLNDAYIQSPQIDSDNLYTSMRPPAMDMYDEPASSPYHDIFGNSDSP
jgi:DNA-binding protein H-NS